MKDLSGVRVAIIGLGVSGVAATRLALAEGGEAYVSDSRTDAAAAARGAELRSAGASVELGGHDIERVAGSGLVVVSPGIPPDAPVLRALAARGVAWISEPELAARFFEGSLIAVTGTNGKTTVTLLVDHLLRTAGLRSAAGGNVGGGLAPAASDLVRVDDPLDWWVLEMSSFQLAGVDTFHPTIGVVTNLSPDHLDRYGSVDAYYADKARMFDTADAGSTWVLPHGDARVERLAGDAPGRRFHFGAGADSNAWVEADRLVVRVEVTEPLCAIDELPLLGAHNVANALTAALTARLAGAPAEAVAEGLRSATPLPHRLQPVAERGGVQWVDDSKATNVAATMSALRSLARPIVLLLGGKDKGEDFGQIATGLVGRVRAVLAYGAAGPRIAEELRAALAVLDDAAERPDPEAVDGGVVVRHDDPPNDPSLASRPIVDLLGSDLAAVVDRAGALARAGDVVLLSPACSSFDMFESYEHRGRAFAALVGERT